MQVIFSENGYLRYYRDGINALASNNRIAFDSLAQIYDGVELLAQLNYVNCEDRLAPDNNIPSFKKHPTLNLNHVNSDVLNQAYMDKVAIKLKKADSLQQVNKTLTTNELIYTFENLQITQTFPRYLEFDVSLSASDNNSFIDNGLAIVQYPKSLFGANIVGNNKITVTRSTVLASAADYDDPIPLYENDSSFKVWIFGKTSNVNRYQLSTTPTPAFHVKIEYSTCNLLGVLRWENPTKMALYSYYTNTATDFNYIAYPITTAADFHDVPRCLPIITDFLPKNVNGGVGDSVTIYGNFFGNQQGKVYLRDADKGAAILLGYVRLDSMDILDWNDNQIKIKIPSYSIAWNNLFGDNHPAGTGIIKILTSSQDTTSSYALNPAKLTIDYSLTTNYRSAVNDKRRVDLVDALAIPGNGGYLFQIPSTLYYNSSALNAVKKAIKEWVCLTNVNFILGDTLSNWTKTTGVEDGKNVIQFGHLPQETFGKTFSYGKLCPNIENIFVTEIDIVLNDSVLSWVYDTTGTVGINIGQEDFYETILHELGHAHSHQHVNNIDDIMYPNPVIYPCTGAGRRIYLASKS